MVQVASLSNQLLHHFPRLEFAGLVKKHQAERAARGFDCWTQFVAMLFCQLGHADSLRDICNGLACCLGKLVHLGIAKAPNKSTLSYANQHRPAELCQELFYTALARFREQQGLGPRKCRFRFRNKLLSLDSTIVSLCLSMFPWALCRRNKGGVKAHVLLDHDDYLPRCVLITPARIPDVLVARSLVLPRGSIVAMDRGYVDFSLFAQWTGAGVFFVTRPLQRALADRAVLQGAQAKPQNQELRGHHRECSAHPDLTALIAMLLLKWLHHLSKANWPLSNQATMLRLNLFTYRDLLDWLHNPFGTLPILPAPEQPLLAPT
jgi:hypothetical protein